MIQPLPVQWAGGVNLFADPSQIRDDQLRYAKNLVPTEGGLVLSSRRAMRATRNLVQNLQIGFVPLRVMASPIGGEFAIAYFDGTVIKFGTIVPGDPVAPVDIAPNGVRNLPISMTQLYGETYIFTGYNPGYALRADPTGPAGYAITQLAFTNIAGTPVTFVPTGAATVRDRLFYWQGRSVVFADRGRPGVIQNIDGNLMSLDVANDTFDGITHIQELNTTSGGSPVQSVAAIWTTDNMYMLLGEPPETGDLDLDAALRAIQVNKLTVAAGCVSGATVAQTPYGTIWAGPDDVWFMPFGALPVRIGTNIRPALLNTPPALRHRWHAAYENGIYRLAIDAPGAGPTEISGCAHHWLLDMRRGPPQNAESAVWWGPQEYNPAGSVPDYGPGTWCFTTSLGNEGDGRVYSLQPWSAADSVGQAHGISLCVLDANQTRDEAAMNYGPNPMGLSREYFENDIIAPYDESASINQWSLWRVTSVNGAGPNGGGVTDSVLLLQFNDGSRVSLTSGGVTFTLETQHLGQPVPGFIPVSGQSGNDIVPELVTKEYVGNPLLDKLYDGASIGYWVNQKGRVTYRAITDVDENVRVLSPAGDDTATSGPLGIGQSSLPIRGQRIWQSRLLPPQAGRRFHAKSLQFRLTHDPAFIVDSTNNVVTMEHSGNLKRGEVVQGAYDTLLDLATAVISAMAGNYQVSVAGSRLHIRETGAKLFAVYFNYGVGGPWPSSDYEKCSRLFSLLGVDTNNQNWYSTLTPTWTWTNGTANSNWVPAKIPAEQTRSFQLDISGLSLRVDTFNREPT